MTPEQVEAVVARVMGDDMAFEQCDERMVPPDIRDRVTAAIREAVAAERGRCLRAVSEVRERAENGSKLSPLPNVGILTRGAMSALRGVESLIREGV